MFWAKIPQGVFAHTLSQKSLRSKECQTTVCFVFTTSLTAGALGWVGTLDVCVTLMAAWFVCTFVLVLRLANLHTVIWTHGQTQSKCVSAHCTAHSATRLSRNRPGGYPWLKPLVRSEEASEAVSAGPGLCRRSSAWKWPSMPVATSSKQRSRMRCTRASHSCVGSGDHLSTAKRAHACGRCFLHGYGR